MISATIPLWQSNFFCMSGLTPKSLGWKGQWLEMLRDFTHHHLVNERGSTLDVGWEGSRRRERYNFATDSHNFQCRKDFSRAVLFISNHNVFAKHVDGASPSLFLSMYCFCVCGNRNTGIIRCLGV